MSKKIAITWTCKNNVFSLAYYKSSAFFLCILIYIIASTSFNVQVVDVFAYVCVMLRVLI